MPEKQTVERAQEDAREGKAPTTQAGEFVREEIHHVRGQALTCPQAGTQTAESVGGIASGTRLRPK